MPIKLDGKALADRICGDLKARCDVLWEKGVQPRLTIVTTNSDLASVVYIRNKVRRCEEIGIEADVQRFERLGVNETAKIMFGKYSPVILQQPMNLAEDVTIEELGEWFPAICDVDGFINSKNIAALASGREPANYPCTPRGIIRLLDEYQIPIEGASVCVIGRSNIVGRPLARMLEQRNATVTLCHSKTALRQKIRTMWNSDIVISATGNRNTLNSIPRGNFDGKVLIDVGINRDEEGNLCGDFPAWAYEYCKAYTPVPGGVGPMTVAMLMENVIRFYERTV